MAPYYFDRLERTFCRCDVLVGGEGGDDNERREARHEAEISTPRL